MILTIRFFTSILFLYQKLIESKRLLAQAAYVILLLLLLLLRTVEAFDYFRGLRTCYFQDVTVVSRRNHSMITYLFPYEHDHRHHICCFWSKSKIHSSVNKEIFHDYFLGIFLLDAVRSRNGDNILLKTL